MEVQRARLVTTLGWVGRVFTAIWFLMYAFQAIKPVSTGWFELVALVAGVGLLLGL